MKRENGIYAIFRYKSPSYSLEGTNLKFNSNFSYALVFLQGSGTTVITENVPRDENANPINIIFDKMIEKINFDSDEDAELYFEAKYN